MPRFFFNIYDGVALPDDVGTELPDWEEARSMAIASAGELIKDRATRKALGEEWRMEVTDESGLVLFRLDFRVLESPAMLGSHRHRTVQKQT